jgi:cellobiose-specific phosphotransferase system component IIB
VGAFAAVAAVVWQQQLLAHLAACVNDLPVADVHEVVVPLPCLDVVVLAPQVLLLLQHLTHVLNHKLASCQVLISIQAMALRARTPLQQ